MKTSLNAKASTRPLLRVLWVAALAVVCAAQAVVAAPAAGKGKGSGQSTNSVSPGLGTLRSGARPVAWPVAPGVACAQAMSDLPSGEAPDPVPDVLGKRGLKRWPAPAG